MKKTLKDDRILLGDGELAFFAGADRGDPTGRQGELGMKTYLLINRIDIHNANAMSSPYTIGFPAMDCLAGGLFMRCKEAFSKKE